jgi:hypothetical protein
MVVYDKFKSYAKIVENSYGPIMTKSGNFPFLENRDISCLLPQVGKSILR